MIAQYVYTPLCLGEMAGSELLAVCWKTLIVFSFLSYLLDICIVIDLYPIKNRMGHHVIVHVMLYYIKFIIGDVT